MIWFGVFSENVKYICGGVELVLRRFVGDGLERKKDVKKAGAAETRADRH